MVTDKTTNLHYPEASDFIYNEDNFTEKLNYLAALLERPFPTDNGSWQAYLYEEGRFEKIIQEEVNKILEATKGLTGPVSVWHCYNPHCFTGYYTVKDAEGQIRFADSGLEVVPDTGLPCIRQAWGLHLYGDIFLTRALQCIRDRLHDISPGIHMAIKRLYMLFLASYGIEDFRNPWDKNYPDYEPEKEILEAYLSNNKEEIEQIQREKGNLHLLHWYNGEEGMLRYAIQDAINQCTDSLYRKKEKLKSAQVWDGAHGTKELINILNDLSREYLK